jgi:hypothetical protein
MEHLREFFTVGREKKSNLSVRDLKTTVHTIIGASEGDFQLIHDDPFKINMCAI